MWTRFRVRVHGFVQSLVIGCHFAGVTFDAADDLVLARLEAERRVEGLEAAALQQLHGYGVIGRRSGCQVRSATAERKLLEIGTEMGDRGGRSGGSAHGALAAAFGGPFAVTCLVTHSLVLASPLQNSHIPQLF